MNRSVYLSGRASVGDIIVLPIEESVSPDVEKRNPLLDEIFAPDENGLLLGDLKHFLNNKTNSEVRQFIEQQLLQERSTGSNPLNVSDEVLNKMRSVITDDDIAFFSRGSDETVEQYAGRVAHYFAKQRSENLAKNYYAKEKERLSKLGYNFD